MPVRIQVSFGVCEIKVKEARGPRLCPSTEPGSVQAAGLHKVLFVRVMPAGQGVGGGPPSPGLVPDR